MLFATTIRENILFGRDGVTQEEIERAAQAANAHNFISQLPDVSLKSLKSILDCILSMT